MPLSDLQNSLRLELDVPSNAPGHPHFAGIYSHWRDLGEDVPRWSDFDPDAFARLRPFMSACRFDRTVPQYRFTMMGDKVADAIGQNATGMALYKAVPMEIFQTTHAAYDRVRKTRAPSLIQRTMTWESGTQTTFTSLILPFREQTNDVTLIVAIADFDNPIMPVDGEPR